MNIVPKICMRKLGMDQIVYNQKEIGVTFLSCEKITVLSHKTMARDKYNAMVLGYGEKKLQRCNKPQHYLFRSLDTGCEKVYESRQSDEVELLSIDSNIDVADLFKLGMYVDVTANTKGRGFSGVMKRHNFAGGPASHGTSLAHRWAGSTGCRTQPGHVFKGKKMAGRYGNEQMTVQNLKVVFSEKMTLNNVDRYIIGVFGAVPGAQNSLCFVKNAIKRGAK